MTKGGMFSSIVLEAAVPPVSWERDDIKVSLVGPGYRPDPTHTTMADVADVVATARMTGRVLAQGCLTADDVAVPIPDLRRPWLRWLLPRKYHAVQWLVVWADRGGPAACPLVLWMEVTKATAEGDTIRVMWDDRGIMGLGRP